MARLAGRFILVLASVSLLGWVVISRPWSGKAEPFAADRDGGFDSLQGMVYLKSVCKIGPRISGSDGMKRQQELLKKHFEERGAKVELQRFSARQRSQKHATDMANLIASWHPERHRRVIVCSHYDTRPIADQEPDRRRWHEDFISANDGGSGIALLMELANHMKELPTEVGVDFVFFDGEEYVFDPNSDQYFFGSEYFAKAYRQSAGKNRYVAAVLLDMVGGKDARFPIERNSWLRAAPLVADLWKIAGEQKSLAFEDQLGPEVRDDHLALNKAGIPAVDIIDFSYPHWHRLTDVPENCSEASLSQVARVLVVWLQRVR